MTGAPRRWHPSVIVRAAAIAVAAVLIGIVSRRRQSGASSAERPTDSWTTTYAADLATDRRFERSLVLRQAAVLLVIAALIVLRELLS